MKITSDRRLALIREVYKAVFHETETFRKNNIGSDLAYLFGAIANNSVVSYTKEPLLRLLRARFRVSHNIWKFIVIEHLS